MDRKKYEFTGETRALSSTTILHRIRAVIDIPSAGVNAGDIGGWIESDSNLSHDYDAWVGGDAWVSGNAWVVSDARVSGNACVGGDAWVDGNAWVGGNARVGGNAWVGSNAWVGGNARVGSNARVDGNACVGGDAWVYGNARVDGNARVSGNARVRGDARVDGDAQVDGNARVGGDAHINSDEDFIVIGPIGSRNGFTTFYKNKDENVCVRCGCFSGTVDEFLAAVQKTHGDSRFGREYRLAAELANAHILEED